MAVTRTVTRGVTRNVTRGVTENKFGAIPADAVFWAPLTSNLVDALGATATFSRAATTASGTTTYRTGGGTLATAATNEVRINSSLGVLLELSRTNTCDRNTDFTDATWTGIAGSTITANATTSPTGSTDADQIAHNSTSTVITNGSQAITANSPVTLSGFFKQPASGAQWVRLRMRDSGYSDGFNGWFDIQNGVVGTLNANTGGTAQKITIEAFANDWYRCSITGIVDATDTLGTLGIANADGDGSFVETTDPMYWWGIQCEVGRYPTSLIITAAAASTRQRDILSWDTSGVPALTTGTDLSVVLSHHPVGIDTSITVFVLAGDGVGDRFFYCSGGITVSTFDGTNILGGSGSGLDRVADEDIHLGMAASAAPTRLLTGFQGGTLSTNSDSDASASYTASVLVPGSSSTATAMTGSGYYRNLQVYDTVKTQAELEAIVQGLT